MMYVDQHGALHRESTKCALKTDAQEQLDKVRVSRADGTLVADAKNVTFEQLVEMLEADYTAKGNRSKPRITGALKDAFGGALAVSITTARVRQYEAGRLAAGVSRSTVNAELAALRRAFRLALEGGQLAVAPVIKTPDPQNARQGFVEPKTLTAVIGELPAWAKPVVEFLALTGWRVRSEVLVLTWKHVDGRAKVVRLEPGTTKNGRGREFPFNEYPPLRALLDRQRAEQSRIECETGAESSFVFPIPGAAHRDVRYKLLRKAWRAACRKARHPRLILHDLRRTAVRNLERAGVSRSVAMSLTGHQTEAVYRRYAIVDSAAQREGVAKLAKLEAIPS
jgi:integrase